MKNLYVVLAALIAGAVGGAISTYAVLAHQHGRPESVIRALRFELVDEAGQPIAFWGTDSTGYEVLTFGPDANAVGARGGNHNQQLSLGLQGKAGRPFVNFSGSDGQIRVLLDVDDFQRPGLWMSDGRNLGLTLGSERSDTPDIRNKTERWSLNFLPAESARIGVSAPVDQTQSSARGFLSIKRDNVKYSPNPNAPSH